MIGTHKTTKAIVNDRLIVTYQNTAVVQVLNNRYVTLDNGGWYTATSKRRMNQASMEYNLGYSVYQVDYEWYVRIGDEVAPYYNGVVIDTDKNMISKKLNDIN